jgi:phosphatidylserine decarboxylase
MATHQPTTAPALTAAPITSVQPGGGFCMNLELAWGRFRRSWLRRRRPDYVRQMAEKRQGQCPNCPHDIIDSRDLKYYRNVCGYWFHDEDDDYRWRGELGFARMGLGELVFFYGVFLVASAILFLLGLVIGRLLLFLFVPLLLAWLEVIWFFRDPDRKIPGDAAAMLSPADGTVTDVGEVDEPDFPGGRAFRIGIFLSVFNVHVNRVPRTARVTAIRYYPGSFLDARHAECRVRNEQLWVDLQEAGSGRPLRVKQIAGKIARRIVCWLRPGEEVRAGDRFGMIKFGSRTELYLPTNAAAEVLVKVGDRVKGGSTVLLRCT